MLESIPWAAGRATSSESPLTAKQSKKIAVILANSPFDDKADLDSSRFTIKNTLTGCFNLFDTHTARYPFPRVLSIMLLGKAIPARTI